MEITIDLELCKVITHFDKFNQYAIFISKIDGTAIRMTIPKLIEELEKARDAKKNQPSKTL